MSKYDNAGLVMIPSGYKASKVYSVIPNTTDGDFDFSRGSTATRVNKDGLIEVVASNVPRLDYPLIDGVVQDCPSLLLEPQRSNLFPYSESFDNAAWNKSSIGVGLVPIVTANQGLAPDGTFTADRIVLNLNGGVGSSDGSFLSETVTVSSAATVSLTIYLKSNTGLTQNLIVWEAFTGTSLSVTLNNEWQRFNVIATVSSTSSGLNFGLRNAFGVTVDDTADILAWGAQLEQGSYPTSYIPTSGSTVTRVAETCNGAGNADTFNGSEGVLFVEMSALANDSTTRRINLRNSSGSNQIRIEYGSSTNLISGILYNGANQAVINNNSHNVIDLNKIVFKYKQNDFALWINGVKVGTDSSGFTIGDGILDRIDLSLATTQTYSNVKQIQYFNKALTDAELEDLTSWDSFLEMATSQLYTIN